MAFEVKICGVYCWTHTPSGRRYIGSSLDCERRRKAHLRSARKPGATCFSRQLATLGADNFTFAIVEECAANKRLEREAHYISAFDTLIPNGFNILKDPTKGTDHYWTENIRDARAALSKLNQSTPEARAAFALRMKAYFSTSAGRAEFTAKMKAWHASPEGRAAAAAHSVRMKEKTSTPEVRAARSERAKAWHAIPENYTANVLRLKALQESRKVVKAQQQPTLPCSK